MDNSTIVIIAAVLVLAILLLIAKRLLRIAIRIVFVGVLLVALLATAAFGWWNGWFSALVPQKPKPAAPARRSTVH